MEDEIFINGFCKNLNQGRMVSVTLERSGTQCALTDVDCDYGRCPYREVCRIAAQIREACGPRAAENQ